MNSERRGFLGGLLALLGFGATTQATQPINIKQLERVVAPLRMPRTNKIRLWKLGNLDHRILPTEKAIEILAETLTKWDGHGDLDLIWGPDLELQQFSVDPPLTNGIDLDVVHSADAEVDTNKAHKGMVAFASADEPKIRIIRRDGEESHAS